MYGLVSTVPGPAAGYAGCTENTAKPRVWSGVLRPAVKGPHSWRARRARAPARRRHCQAAPAIYTTPRPPSAGSLLETVQDSSMSARSPAQRAEREGRAQLPDGDGSVVMHMGNLLTNVQANPRKMLHIVFNNGTHAFIRNRDTGLENTNLTAQLPIRLWRQSS